MATKAEDYDFVGSYDNQRVSPISAERSVNLFEYIDPEGKKPKCLISTAGLVDQELDFQFGTGGSRATFVFKDAIYQVFGAAVYQITGTTGALITSHIGDLSTTVGYVGIDANTFQVIFVDGFGGKGFIYDTNALTFVEITDTSFPDNPIDVCFIDGFFIVAHGGTNEFQMSKFDQGLIWGPDFTAAGTTGNAFVATSGASPNLVLSTGTTLNYQIGTPIQFNGAGTLPVGTPAIAKGVTYYVVGIVNATTFTISTTVGGTPITFATVGTAPIFVTNGGQAQVGTISSHPGNIVGCRTLHRRIFLFSENFTEVWENAGAGTNLPIRRNNSLLMEVGTPALGSIIVGFDRMFFLAQDRDGLAGVMGVAGSESTLLSNRALDFQLAQYAADPLTGVADARSVLIKENGLIFYRLNFTAANHTFVLGVTMSTPDSPKWHEEEVLNGDRHPAQSHAYFHGVNYYADYNQKKFYMVDDEVSTNDGEHIRRMRIGKQMTPPGYNRIRIDRWQLDLLQGQRDILRRVDITLDTEDSQIITTENDIDLILDQGVLVGGGQPVVYLSYSKDGGQTYGFQQQGLMGKLGQRTYRTVWRKLGVTPRGQGYVPKIEFYADYPLIVLGAAWAYEILPE
jgi:hypothetical protein